jgi:FkbM family methyltransferase
MAIRKILKTLRRSASAALGRDFFERPDVSLHSTHLGTEYGGWQVLLERLNPKSVIYSAGLGEDASFDLELVNRVGATVHVFDPTPRSMAWARGQNFPDQIKLHAIGLADYDGMASFAPPDNPAHVSHSMAEHVKPVSSGLDLPVKRLTTLMAEHGHTTIDLFKMDIEGAEYAVVSDLLKSGVRPRQLLVEFHHRFPSIGAAKSKRAIAELRAKGYSLFHVTDSGEEFSFALE